jgi:hypothetical protein
MRKAQSDQQEQDTSFIFPLCAMRFAVLSLTYGTILLPRMSSVLFRESKPMAMRLRLFP